MRNAQYQLKGKKCRGKTIVGPDLQRLHCGEGCPAIIEDGDDHILVIGRQLDMATLKNTSVQFRSGEMAVAIPADLFRQVAEEMKALV